MSTMEVRDYEVGDESHIISLFQATFGRTLNLSEWNWRYRENPVDRPRILLAWDGGQLAAHYAVSPTELYFGNQRSLGGLSMTTMTHPDYRGKGLFVRLASDLYRRLASDGYRLVFGYPNRQSHAGFVDRLGWQNGDYVPQHQLPVETVFEGRPLLEHAPEPTPDHCKLIKGTFADGWLRPVRDLERLRWRYRDHPSGAYRFLDLRERSGELDAFAVVKPYQSSLDVLEFVYRDPDAASSLAAGLQRYAQGSGLCAVNLWLSLDEPAYSRLERLGMVPNAPVTYFGTRSFQPIDGHDPGMRWLQRMGLSDVY